MGSIRQCPTCGQVIKSKEMTMQEVLEERIAIVKDYAAENPEFDTDFIESLEEQLERSGHLTPKQIATLNNIIDKYGME